ncbi:MAG: glycosyltransferase [Rhodobacteraceae bacterium]|nr:glycosyltransferase [Paracoccaceae bacterium]
MTAGGLARVARVAVVIPFFQREAGILRRAVAGVLAQDLPPGVAVRIVVVDDGSPRPAAEELAGLAPPPPFALELVARPNGGPAAARNSGIEAALAAQAEAIAFLDSDDTWAPAHLKDALQALARGYDFYFCDARREGVFERLSEEDPRLAAGGAALAARSVLLDPDGPVRGFAPHALDEAFLTGYLSHTSAVVVSSGTLGALRFDPDLRGASEDRMFWIALARSGARVAISWRCHVDCGRGVNLFFSAHDWDSPATLERIGAQLLFAEKLLRLPDLPEAGRAFALARARRARRAYAFLFARSLARGRRPPTGALRRLLRFDRWLPLRLPLLALGVLADRSPDARRF